MYKSDVISHHCEDRGPERSAGSRALTRRGEVCVASPGGVAASEAKPPASVQYIYIYIYIYKYMIMFK